MFGSYNCMHPFGIVVAVLGIDFLVILMGVHYARAKSVKGKSRKAFGERKGYVITLPILQLIWMALRQRLRCWDVTFMTIFMDIIFIILCQVFKGDALFVVSVVFMIFLYLLEDRFFEIEGMNVTYYKSIGISLKKYLYVQIWSSIVYSEIIVLIFFAINSQSVLQIILFVLLLFVFSFYWCVSFIYSESKNLERFAKFWYEIIRLWISFVPIVNVVWIYKKYNKMKKEWNHD